MNYFDCAVEPHSPLAADVCVHSLTGLQVTNLKHGAGKQCIMLFCPRPAVPDPGSSLPPADACCEQVVALLLLLLVELYCES